MIDQVMFHAAHGRGAARFSAACFFATLMLVAAAPFVSAQTNSCGGDHGEITLPPGFCATIFADNLGHARQMAFGPNGVLYLNTWSGGYYQNGKPPDGGFLVALKDTKGDGRADVMARFGDGVAQGSAGGTGIRIYNGGLFAEQNDKIIRYPLPANGFVPGEQPRVIVSGLPLTGDHPMHPFIIDAEGHLFVDLGSATNSCQKENRIANSPGYQPCIELQTRAGTWLYDANKEDQRFSPRERYVTGLRNGEGFAFDSAGRLFATMHGRDQLSQNWPSLFTADQSAQLPAEEIVQLEKGADYGWPNDLLIYSGNAFPAAHQGGAFVAFHGSWNRSPDPQGGYNVVFQPLKDGKPSGPFVVFADGFAGAVKQPGQAAHRPSGLAMGPDGALYISDDWHGRIWRVTYHGDPNAQVTAAPSPKVAATTSGEPGPPEGIHPEAGRLASLPVPAGATPGQVLLGGRIFNGEDAGGTCLGCHGYDAKGSPQAPALDTGKWLDSDGSLSGITRTITDGVPKPKHFSVPMPARGGAPLSDSDVAAVAAYVWAVGHPAGK